MKLRSTAVICVVVTFSAYASLTHANNENTGNQRMAQQPDNPYWQAPPNWSAPNQIRGNQQPAHRPPPPPRYMQPSYNNYNQAPPRQPARNYRPPQQGYNPAYAPPPPPNGPYPGSSYGPNSGASAFNTPGYRDNRGNNWNNNKYWGRSGPSTWMNPNKRNMEQGWDDMINTPSRMGEMPGGWTAPEVSMPNPIDMGDQIQENVKDLPEQIRNMDVGN